MPICFPLQSTPTERQSYYVQEQADWRDDKSQWQGKKPTNCTLPKDVHFTASSHPEIEPSTCNALPLSLEARQHMLLCIGAELTTDTREEKPAVVVV